MDSVHIYAMEITIRDLPIAGPTIHSIFESLPFIKTTPDASSQLQRPVLALQTESCIKIVGNIHLFRSAQETGLSTVPVYLIQDASGTMELLQLVAEYYQPMNLMDKALLVRAAIDLGVPRNLLAKDLLPSLQLPPLEETIPDLLFVLKLPPFLQHFIVDKDLSIKRALIFRRAEPHLDWVEAFIRNLRTGINLTAEIIQNIWEMAQRDDKDFKTMAQDMGLWELAYESLEDPRHAIMTIRQKITEARYPLLTEAGKRLSKAVADADLPVQVKVTWDPFFEKQGVDISFHARDAGELEDIVKKLNTAPFKNIFNHI